MNFKDCLSEGLIRKDKSTPERIKKSLEIAERFLISAKKNIEIEGSTVEDAIQKALVKFKVSREELSIKIVSEEQRGLFGMQGAKPAKIVVQLKEKK